MRCVVIVALVALAGWAAFAGAQQHHDMSSEFHADVEPHHESEDDDEHDGSSHHEVSHHEVSHDNSHESFAEHHEAPAHHEAYPSHVPEHHEQMQRHHAPPVHHSEFVEHNAHVQHVPEHHDGHEAATHFQENGAHHEFQDVVHHDAAHDPHAAAQHHAPSMGVHAPEHHAVGVDLPHTTHTVTHGDVHHDPLAHTVTHHPHDTVTVIRRLTDSPLEDIQWASDEVVFVLTEKGQVWMSTNSGQEFKNIMPRLQSQIESPTVKSIYISAVDSSMIFLLGSTRVNWWSADQGKNFHTTEQDLHDVRLHPTQKQWMLGAAMSDGCTNHESHVPCYKELKVSKDFGATWAEVTTYVVQFDWSPPVGPAHDGNRASDDLIYVTHHHNKHGTQKFGFWDKDINFVSSYNYFKSAPTVLVAHGNRFLFGEHAYLFVAAVNPLHETEVHLMISRDNETHALFQRAILPVDLTQHSYTILDTSQGSVFVHVNHQPFSENSATGHVYISDWSGLVYSMSLPYNHRSADGKCDFEKVEGLEGIYLANFIDEAAEGQKEIDIEEAEENPSHGHAANNHRHHRAHRSKAKTVITFDKGGLWSYLEAPSHDSHGQPITCQGACHLHLHGVTDTFGPFYSTATATGLIMATGTVGNYLQEDSEINTYLSRDAGLTWSEVHKGSHIYEFGDHGGLLVMADDTKPSKHVLYSWDSGHTWDTVEISDVPFQIENIIIEPTATSQVFVVYGWHEGHGVLVYLNFATLHARECTGRDHPGTDASDYELWTPHGEPPSKCLMGHTVHYTRRKADAACFNPEQYERVSSYTNCPCTAEDFECDYGYERKELVDEAGNKKLDGECVPMATPPAHQDPTAHKPCHTTQRITRGYRRVPGDTCEGGLDHFDALEVSCPSFLSSGSFGKFFLFLFLVLAIIACVMVAGVRFNLPCMPWLRRMGLGAGHGPSYAPVGSSAHEPDDATYLDEDEFGKSAELLADGIPNKKAKKNAGAAASASGAASSSGSSSAIADSNAGLLDAAVIDDDHDAPKPLPPAKLPDGVPALLAPKGDDDFNPRKSN